MPGEAEKELGSVSVAGQKRKEKDAVNVILTLRQSIRQTSGPTVEEAADRETCRRPGFSSGPRKKVRRGTEKKQSEKE